MKFNTSDLKQDRQWRAMIGMSEKQFYTLSDAFTKAYFDTYRDTLNQRKVQVNIEYCIQNEEELLLFTLMSLKLGLTYDALGVACGMSASNALRNQNIGLDVLATALDHLGVMPKRKQLLNDLEITWRIFQKQNVDGCTFLYFFSHGLLRMHAAIH